MNVRTHLLMVEDHTKYHKIYESTLGESLDCHIDFATTGAEAIKLVETGKYDLMILDYNLPDLSGEQILIKIRNDPTYAGLPIIFLTGEATPNLQTRLLDIGADDFIEKSSTPEVIIARVTVQLRHKFSLDKTTQLAMEVEAFTTGVLHDIRNIEHNISTTCYLAGQLLEESAEENKQEVSKYLKRISNKAGELSSYASGIIEQVKSVSSIKNQVIEPVEILDWVKNMIGEEVALNVESNIPSVVGDPQLLKLVFLNIIQNSAKYSRESVKPEVIVRYTVLKNNLIEIHIDDNGIGIADGEHRKVFGAFVRGKDTAKSNAKGFGLGLSMVSRAILKMGGKIRAEKTAHFDQGTKMVITLVESFEKKATA